MLTVYRELFKILDKNSITYSAFKSLEHLQEDLDGERGDVDIWFAQKDKSRAISAARRAGFFNVRWASTKRPAFIMAGWDIPSGKKVLLHIHLKPIAIKKRSLLPLFFTYNLPPKPDKPKQVPKQPSAGWVERFEADRKSLKSQNDLWLLKQLLSGGRKIKQLNFKFSFFNTFALYPTYIRRFVFNGGRYPIRRKGLFIALVGVDGSGKSTAVENLGKSDFLRTTQGVNVKYFGNNDFWIPGLNKSFGAVKGLNPKTLIVLGLSVLDRKLRVLPAYITKLRGRVVICDRYFYDQNIVDPTAKYLKNRFLKALLNPFIQWMPVKPDLTLYLRISPEAAYKRKQDYGFEKVQAMCAAYDELLLKRPEVIAIDAEAPLETVQQTIRQRIVKALKGPDA
ncbi:MAG TPA: hypothetical protein VHD84_03385 [Candidatus Saccharimonadales bacterium]|nr:hypothetical protein [Candidatus Saccharimonadales bacterium]